jgi:hypothetical protein
MYENGKVRPVEAILRMCTGGQRMMEDIVRTFVNVTVYPHTI